MHIYLAHSTRIDFQSVLYEPIKASALWQQHTWIFPHDPATPPFNSKEVIEKSNLMFVDVSRPSLGVGIEMGWAQAAHVPIVCIHPVNTTPTSSIHFVTQQVFMYHSAQNLIEHLQQSIAMYTQMQSNNSQ